jgi:hypothetical protein
MNDKPSLKNIPLLHNKQSPATGPRDHGPIDEPQGSSFFLPIKEPQMVGGQAGVGPQEQERHQHGLILERLPASGDDSDSDGVYDMDFDEKEGAPAQLAIFEESFSEFFEQSADRDRPQINLKHVIPFGRGLIGDSSHFNETIPLNPAGNNEEGRIETPNRSSKKSRTEPEKNSSFRDSANSPLPEVRREGDIIRPSRFMKSILKSPEHKTGKKFKIHSRTVRFSGLVQQEEIAEN